jgi:hypothetical protein
MPGVQQPIKVSAAPLRAEVQPDLKYRKAATDRCDGHSVDLATLDN